MQLVRRPQVIEGTVRFFLLWGAIEDQEPAIDPELKARIVTVPVDVGDVRQLRGEVYVPCLAVDNGKLLARGSAAPNGYSIVAGEIGSLSGLLPQLSTK